MRDVDVVFHAAALKHVELSEYNPFEAVKTNVLGAQHVIKSALHTGVETVVNVSTDKASMPVSVMGATKLLTKRLFNAGNVCSGRKGTWYASATCSTQPGRSCACSDGRSRRGDR
jgi:FlaA1/EpsC-like NDP-sugar epimerase